jgi:hypothetical protein
MPQATWPGTIRRWEQKGYAARENGGQGQLPQRSVTRYPVILTAFDPESSSDGRGLGEEVRFH